MRDVYYYAFSSLLYIKILLQAILNASTRNATFLSVYYRLFYKDSYIAVRVFIQILRL